jgi:hypothetical protein
MLRACSTQVWASTHIISTSITCRCGFPLQLQAVGFREHLPVSTFHTALGFVEQVEHFFGESVDPDLIRIGEWRDTVPALLSYIMLRTRPMEYAGDVSELLPALWPPASIHFFLLWNADLLPLPRGTARRYGHDGVV